VQDEGRGILSEGGIGVDSRERWGVEKYKGRGIQSEGDIGVDSRQRGGDREREREGVWREKGGRVAEREIVIDGGERGGGCR
jgi:hypothetical protein